VTDPAAADAIRGERMDAASRTSRVLAHEIANYLGSVRTYLYLLREEMGADPKAAEDLETVSRTVESAATLVAALRGFAHAPALGAGPADLGRVLRDAEPALRALLPAGKTLELAVAAEPLPVAADATRLAQLVVDLVDAANRALPVGGCIRVTATRDAGGPHGAALALLAVRDDGPGLDPERAAHIFEPFVFDLAHDQGLRLPTLYNTVTRSGAAITAESAPGAGTTIRVAFPLAPAGKAAAR